MILGIIIFIAIIKAANKLYRKSKAHNAKLYGNYLYEIIRTANKG